MPKYTHMRMRTSDVRRIFPDLFSSTHNEDQVIVRFTGPSTGDLSVVGYFQGDLIVSPGSARLSLQSMEQELLKQKIWYCIETCSLSVEHKECGCLEVLNWVSHPYFSGAYMCHCCTKQHARVFESFVPKKTCDTHRGSQNL